MSGLHPLRVSRVGRIADVHPATWASLERGRNLYQSHPWLQWAEQSCGVPARYVLVHATSGALVAAMPCYLLTRAQTSWNSWYDPLHVLTGEVADQAAPNWYPVLLLGSVSGYRTDLLIHPALAPHDRESVLQALLQGCASLGADLGASARAFMYAPPDTARTTASLSRGEGAMAPLLTSAASRIVPTGRTLDEWLATFGQKRRCALRRELTMFRDGPAVVQRCRLSACLEAVGPLLGNLHRRHGAQDSDEETGRYLASQAEHLDDVSDVFLEMVDGRPAGFSLCYQWGRDLYVRVVGFDYERSTRFAYFNLAYYLPVALALERCLDQVHLGPGTYAPKTARGAVLDATWSVVWPPDGAARAWFDGAQSVGVDAREAEPWLVAGHLATL